MSLFDDDDIYIAKPNVTPEEAIQNFNASRVYETPLAEVSKGMREDLKDKQLLDGAGPAFKKNIQDPNFRAAIKGQEEIYKKAENAAQQLGVMQKGAVQGWYDIKQSGLGYEAYWNRDKIDIARKKLLANPNDEQAKRDMENLSLTAKEIAKKIARNSLISKAITDASDYESRVASGDYSGLDYLQHIAQTVFRSFPTVVPGIIAGATVAATAPASVALGASAGAVGASSFSMDYSLGLISKMESLGIDTTDANAVEYFLTKDSRFGSSKAGAFRHAVGVGAFDALAQFAGGKFVSKTLGSALQSMPPAAAFVADVSKNGMTKALGHGLVQSQIQGVLGGAGEAVGQLLDEGKITDTSAIRDEYFAEVFMAPFETTVSAHAAHREAVFNKRIAQANKEALAGAVSIVNATSAQQSPELRDTFINDVVESTPQLQSVSVDIPSLHQSNSEIVDAIATALPDRAEEIRKSVETGAPIELSLNEYIEITKEEANREAILDNSSVTGDPTALEAEDAEKSIQASRKFAMLRYASGQSDAFVKDFVATAHEVDSTFRADGNGQTTERAAIFSLVMSHISSIAKDTGMLPSEIWSRQGIQNVLRGEEATYDDNGNIVSKEGVDVVRDKEGKWYAVSEKGKKALANGVSPQDSVSSLDESSESFDKSLHQNILGEFIPDTNTIIRWANANRSTLLHETGHWFLKARVQVAADLKLRGNLTEAQQFFVDTTERAVKWLGAKDLETFASMDLESSRDMQEKFARTYEQYLKEGKAPNSALVSVFRKFSGWLKRIYGALNKIKGSDLTPDVQELFDSLFVSHEQVKEAQMRHNMFLILDDMKRSPNGAIDDDGAMKLINAMLESYDDACVEEFNSRGAVAVGYIKRLHDRVFNSLTNEAKKVRSEIEKEEIRKVIGDKRANAMTIFAAGVPQYNSSGKPMRVKPKFHTEELASLGIPKEKIDILVKNGLATPTKGIHTAIPANMLSKHLGYSSVFALVNDFTTDPFMGKKPEDFVKNAVEQRMADEHPDLMDEESIRDSANAAVFNKTAERIITLEIAYLSGADKGLSLDLYKAVAEAELRDRRISDIDPQTYRRAASRQAEIAQRLLAEGKEKEAAGAKRRQLLQTFMADLAQKHKDKANLFIKKMQKRFEGKKKSESIHLDYLKQIKALLHRVGIISDELQGTPSWEEFFNSEQGASFLPGIPSFLGSDLNGVKFENMTVEEADRVIEFANQFLEAAKERYSIMVDGKRIQLELIDEEESSAIESNAQRLGYSEVQQNTRNHEKFGLKVARFIREFKYNHARFQTLWTVFEGEKFGKFFEYFGKRIDAARDRRNELTYEKTKAYYELMLKLKDALMDRTSRHYEMLGGSFDKEQIIGIALQIGNESNFNRLLDGSDKYYDFRDKNPDGTLDKWTRQDVLDAISITLTSDELKVIQEIWNLVGSLAKEQYDLNVRTRNEQVDNIEAMPVTLRTVDGKAITLPGGYYPVKYDYLGSNFFTDRDYESGLNGAPAQRRRNSDSGHSKERGVRTGNPIELTPNAGYEMLNDIINDICWREVLVDINKLISPRSKTRAAIQKYFGKQAVSELEHWVSDVATMGKAIPTSKWEDLIRKNVSIAGLGFNLVTAALQPIGMTQSAAVIGPKWCVRAMGEYLRNPKQAGQLVLGKSSMMRSRIRTRFKELSEVQTQFDGSAEGFGKFRDALARKAFIPIVFTQMYTVDIPTWMAAYDRFTEEGRSQGLDGQELEDFAVSRADRSVVDSQGSGDLSDLAQIERKKNVWNVFYSFFGTVLNACVTLGHTDRTIEGGMKIAMILCLQPVIESVFRAGIESLAKGSEDDDDTNEEKAQKFMVRMLADVSSFQLGMFVYARELSPGIQAALGQNSFGYSGPGGVRLLSDAYKFFQQVGQGELDKGLAKATASVVGDITGMPSTVINRMIDTADGAINGDNFEFYNYLFGPMIGYKGK